MIGVDLSGGARAGAKIWVAEGAMIDGVLALAVCRPACDLPGGGLDRSTALAALRAHIAAAGPCAVGCDVPFGLPAALVDAPDWPAFLVWFVARYPTAEAFRDDCRARAGGREWKRVTDIDARTPFAAYNLRLYRQTYHGLRDLVAPLLREGVARVLPMQPPLPGRARLLEVCPASTLRRAGIAQGYKGRTTAHAAARARILDALPALFPVRAPDEVRRVALADPEGDALDSVIAAVATARAQAAPLPPLSAIHRVEGYVYV